MDEGRRNQILLVAALLLIPLNYFNAAGSFIQGVVQDILLFLLIPLALLHVLKSDWGSVGLKLGDICFGLRISMLLIALSIPFMVYGSGLVQNTSYYPLWEPAGQSQTNFLIYEALIAVRMAATELIFRGMVFFPLLKQTSLSKSHAIHGIIYMLAHVGKPSLEVPYSFFAGVAFAEADRRSDSLLPSFIMHFTTSVMFDMMVILH